MQCRYRWWAKWVMNRVPRDEDRPLTYGKLLHQVFEDFLLGKGQMEDIINQKKQEVEAKLASSTFSTQDIYVASNSLEDLEQMREPLCLWRDQYPFDTPTLEVEESFSFTSPITTMANVHIVLVGRPDRVGILYGKLFHVQNRSLSSSTNYGLYFQLAKRHLHELVYGYHLSRKYHTIPYGGTIFNLLRKLKYRGVPTKANPEGRILHAVDEILHQGLVNYSQEEINEGMRRATLWGYEMYWTEQQYKQCGTVPLPNERMNGGYYGNKIDPYFLVLTGQTTLENNDLFKDREDLYASAVRED